MNSSLYTVHKHTGYIERFFALANHETWQGSSGLVLQDNLIWMFLTGTDHLEKGRLSPPHGITHGDSVPSTMLDQFVWLGQEFLCMTWAGIV